MDSADNVIAVGSFSNTITCAGRGRCERRRQSILIMKLDTLGNAVWCKRFGSTGDDEARSVAKVASDGIVVGGTFTGQSTSEAATG